MLIVSLVAATLAALLHVYIFVMESLLWTTPRVRATFGITDDRQAEFTKPMAFNQGFYNLFLAIVTIVGVVLVASSRGGAGQLAEASPAGLALLVAGTGSMLAAALVLALSDRTKLRAAATQGLFPLVALVALLVAAL